MEGPEQKIEAICN